MISKCGDYISAVKKCTFVSKFERDLQTCLMLPWVLGKLVYDAKPYL